MNNKKCISFNLFYVCLLIFLISFVFNLDNAQSYEIFKRVKIIGSDEVNIVDVNSDGFAGVVSHAHPDSVVMHFHQDGIAGDSTYILWDLSDTTLFKHKNTNYIHIEWIKIETDASAAGNYKVYMGFLKNVDDTNGDLWTLNHWSASLQTGNNINEFINYSPNGAKCDSTFFSTHGISYDSTKFQTDRNLPNIITPTVYNTPSGDGDGVLWIINTAGSLNLTFDIGFHSH